jgi:ssDNA-binding replication factor A large subunit
MYDFESLTDEVLRNKPEITREELMSMIQEKKQTVGAGFLTDQGALFLIAGELGVQLQRVTTTDLTLKDLYVGANDITVVARILAIYPVSEYNKKDGGGIGRYRRLVLFDRNNLSKLTIWDDNAEAIKLEGMSVDSPVRVLNGYVRQGLDGKPNLNLGRRGKIELLGDEKLISLLVPLSGFSKKVDEIGELQELAAVEGVALTGSRSSNFTRKDGSPGSLTQFELGGESEKVRIRMVVWDAVDLDVKPGQKVMATNIRVKKSLNGERELHGDSGSIVRAVGESKGSLVQKLVKVNQVKTAHQKYSVEVMALSIPAIHEVRLKDGSSVQKAEVVFGDDTGEITVVSWRTLVERLAKVSVGEKVRITDATAQTSRLGTLTLELEDGSGIEKVPS